MKLAVLLVGVFGAVLANAGPALDTELFEVQGIEDEIEQSKRVTPNVKDTIHVSCCQHFKTTGQCNFSPIYKVCQFTCACYNILSDQSCGILKGKGECKRGYYKKYCRKACDWCPWLASCPAGWKKFQGRCYMYYGDKKSWGEARASCKSQGADLVTIHSKAENTFVHAMVADPHTWIGLHREAKGKFTKWVDGSNLGYTNWNKGEPNNQGGNEKCVLIYKAHSGAWNDWKCPNKIGYVCEK